MSDILFLIHLCKNFHTIPRMISDCLESCKEVSFVLCSTFVAPCCSIEIVDGPPVQHNSRSPVSSRTLRARVKRNWKICPVSGPDSLHAVLKLRRVRGPSDLGLLVATILQSYGTIMSKVSGMLLYVLSFIH